jgi:hypothetical protein
MHCELLVPGLFAQRAATRLPGLELLLARGRCASAGAQRAEDWLRDAFELGEVPLPAGALSVLGAGGEPGDALWARADPVHLQLMRDHLILVPGAALEVTREEAERLAAALGFQALTATAWAARVDFTTEASSPLDVAGHAIELRAHSPAHAALNEAQMMLHEHPVNAAREARGVPALNSVWLWGSGRAPKSARGRWSSVSAADPVALGLGRLAGAQPRAAAASADDWLRGMPGDGRHLVVLEDLRVPLEYQEKLARLERDWFAPLLAALRAGRVGMVTIHVPDGPECSAYETIRADLRRFWRRPKALESYLA